MSKPENGEQEFAKLLAEVRELRGEVEALKTLPGVRGHVEGGKVVRLPPDYAVMVRPVDNAVRLTTELPPDYAVMVRPATDVVAAPESGGPAVARNAPGKPGRG